MGRQRGVIRVNMRCMRRLHEIGHKINSKEAL